MKITYMLKREDFYRINRNTLTQFYKDSTRQKRLYIYPELNAIVTKYPSKAVRQYLYTEYRVNGSLLKRILVRLYAMVLLNSGGLLASKTLKIKTDADKNTLIYPCNKKYRVFDFSENCVSVLGKEGFPEIGIAREIDFRIQNVADFIPGFVRIDKSGYTEAIIDGCPVARTGDRMKALSDRAFAIWYDFIYSHTQQVPAGEYAQILQKKTDALKQRATELKKTVNIQKVEDLCDELRKALEAKDTPVPVGMSHGDLQPGNIWVENNTDKIYIIDWESCERRSNWYDRAVLYEDLRKTSGIIRYAGYRDLVHCTVLWEDMIFRLEELTTLPYDYGSRDFDTYINMLRGGNGDV